MGMVGQAHAGLGLPFFLIRTSDKITQKRKLGCVRLE